MEWSCHLSAPLLRRTRLGSFSHNKINLSEVVVLSLPRAVERWGVPALSPGVASPGRAPPPAPRPAPSAARPGQPCAALGKAEPSADVLSAAARSAAYRPARPPLVISLWCGTQTRLTLTPLFPPQRDRSGTGLLTEGAPLSGTAELLIEFLKPFRR